MKRAYVLGSVLVVVGCASDPVQDPTSDIVDDLTTTRVVLTGDVVVEGCTPTPDAIAVTMSAAAVGTQVSQVPPVPIRGAVTATQNPHRFKVRFDPLRRGVTYRIAATTNAPNCPKVVWQGPRQGWWTAGAGEPLQLTGYALTTQIEVLGMRGQDAQWLGADALDLGDPNGGVRTLRWRTQAPGAVAGLVEISADPFVVGGQSPTLLTSYRVPIAQDDNGWSSLSIDFAALTQSPCDLQQNPNGCPNTVEGATRRELRNGAPFHVRVVPLKRNGSPIPEGINAGVAAHVTVAHLPQVAFVTPPPPPPVAPLLIHTEYQKALPEVALGHNGGCYRVLRDHTPPPLSPMKAMYASDPWGWKLAYSFGLVLGDGIIHEGQEFCIDISGGGFVDDVVDAISGLVDAIGDTVTSIAKLYAEIKEAVVEFAADIIDKLGVIECGPVCKRYLMEALDTGLAAMGLPPSLPTWDELVADGKDYLIKEAAEETGLPEDTCRDIVDKTVDAMSASRPLPLADWLIADDRFRPERLEITLTKNPASAAAVPGLLRFSPEKHYFGTDVVTPTMALENGDSVRVPVQLLPSFDGIAPPPQVCVPAIGSAPSWCYDISAGEQQLYYEHAWYERYAAQHCQLFHVEGYYTSMMGDSRFVLPGPGTQLLWNVSTLGADYGDNPFLFDCPP